MKIKEAIKILDKFTTEHKLFNIKHSDGLEEAVETLLTAYEKEKEKNKNMIDFSKLRLSYYDNGKGMQVIIEGFISKDKIREIIYPMPGNRIPIEIQQSGMYKKLLKQVEE